MVEERGGEKHVFRKNTLHEIFIIDKKKKPKKLTNPYTHAESNSAVTQAHPPAAPLLAEISLVAGEELSFEY